jgi:hypothetical protein
MRCDLCRGARRSGSAGSRLWEEPRLRVFGVVMVMLLCGGLGCGRKGPLKPLNKEAPAYNFMQTGAALPDSYTVPE